MSNHGNPTPGASGAASERAASTVVRTAGAGWRALPYPGVSAKVLRRDPASSGSTSLIRLEAGARIPAHDHPAGEELYVLEGDFQVGADRLLAGDYLYTPPHVIHAASSAGGCVVLVALPRPVEFVKA